MFGLSVSATPQHWAEQKQPNEMADRAQARVGRASTVSAGLGRLTSPHLTIPLPLFAPSLGYSSTLVFCYSAALLLRGNAGRGEEGC